MFPDSVYQNVQTYCDAKLINLQNLNCFVAEGNNEFQNFQNRPANLGDTVNIELPTRATTSAGLVANFGEVKQYLQPLVCDQAANSAQAYTAQGFLFNAREYMEKFGRARMMEISAKIEASVAKNANSSVPVNTVSSNGNTVPTGALHTESGPFRFFGNGVTPINSFELLAQIETSYRNFGSTQSGPLKVFLPDTAIPQIIGNGQNQFVLDRNNKMSNSWDLGMYKGGNSRYFKSNLLPIQFAGTVGENGDTLTLVSTNDPTGNAITQLTFSGVTDANSIAFKAGDLLRFRDNVGSFRNLRYLTYTGHETSDTPVQMRVVSDAQASSGTVTISIQPTLQWTFGLDQNLNQSLQAGMQVNGIPSHRCGLVVDDNALFVTMPDLPPTSPFASHTSVDPKTKVSIRNYFGYMMALNNTGYITDCIWASTVPPVNCMRLVFPLS